MNTVDLVPVVEELGDAAEARVAELKAGTTN